MPDVNTRDRLLDAAVRLMLAGGYNAARVDAICSAANVTKGAFFHYFPSKRDIGLAALERFAARQMSVFDVDLTDRGPGERLYAFLDHLRALGTTIQGQPACLLGIFALELGATDPVLRGEVSQRLGGLEQHTTELVREAFAHRGVLVDAAALGRHFVVLLEGALLMARAHADSKVIIDALDHYEAYVRLLLGDKRPAPAA